MEEKAQEEARRPEMNRKILGHPACPKALKEIREGLAETGTDTPVGLILPPVTASLEEQLETLLEAAGPFEDVEITVNDWGTLERVSEWKRGRAAGTKLILGILLSGQDSDPVLRLFCEPQQSRQIRNGQQAVTLRWVPPPESLRKHWGEPSAFHLADLLRSMGVDAVELGCQPLPPAEAYGALPARQVPYGLLSMRPCPGDCSLCGGKELVRAGCRAFFDRNLLIWTERE